MSNAAEFVSAADWDTMETVTVELGEFSFTLSDLTFETGKPYKLEVVNTGSLKHYFTAAYFYVSAVFRKAQDGS